MTNTITVQKMKAYDGKIVEIKTFNSRLGLCNRFSMKFIFQHKNERIGTYGLCERNFISVPENCKYEELNGWSCFKYESGNMMIKLIDENEVDKC